MNKIFILSVTAFLLSGCMACHKLPGGKAEPADATQKEASEAVPAEVSEAPAQPESMASEETPVVKPAAKKTPKNIQTALKNAGLYDGPIDGKVGPKTKKAIKEFQSSHSLVADGVVGKKTWKELSKYLE
jgi:peptidoglycan hydrolase-like protein with peptidoglycan-binding domain